LISCLLGSIYAPGWTNRKAGPVGCLAQGLQSAQQTTWNFPLSFGLATIDDIRPLFFATGPACSGPEDRERLLLHVKAGRGRYCFRERGKCPIVDEPFGALDYVTKRQLHDVLLKLWAQSDGKNRRTVLFVTHDVDEALTLADRILVLHSGRLVDDLGISVLRPRTADSLLLAGDDASKARVSRPPWPRRRNGARGSHGRLGAGMIKSFTRAVHRAPTSLLVLAGMAGFWQVLSMIFRAEALPGEPMVPGWRYRGRVGLEGSCAVAYSRLRLYPEGRTNFGLQLHSANERDGPKTSLSGRK
jgi:hypothetical protein